MIAHLLAATVLVAMAFANAQQAPDVPDKIKAPGGEKVVFVAHATGYQLYVCQPSADGKLGWTLKAPEAELKDDQGNVIGHHFAGVIGHHSVGPHWKHKDGSEITGKMAARADAPDGSIPWLLLSVTGHSGQGVLSEVTSIQRVNTKGGQPPSGGCESGKEGTEAKSSYTADYYFFAPAK